MASSKEHYERVLSPVYAWMYGGFSAALKRNVAFFAKHELSPRGSRIAVDLGAGCGFQSIPLAQLGYVVTAIDLDGRLLAELNEHAGSLPIETIEDDLLRFAAHVGRNVELAVCMTDTVLHLESKADVRELFARVHAALAPGGRFVLTFRDTSVELAELDRFIPVRSDDDTVFTCFLEYEPETVKVHDLVYRKRDGAWELHKSYYRKLRLSPLWVASELADAGFAAVSPEVDKVAVTVVAAKSE